MRFRSPATARSASITLRSLASLLLLVVVTGCASIPRDMVGRYAAQHDFIVIKRDGGLYWSPMAKTDHKLTFVGIATPDKDDALRMHLVVPSTSPFLSSSLRFSPDRSRVTIDWGTHAEETAIGRSTEFERSPSR